jgi:hypothetical protein
MRTPRIDCPPELYARLSARLQFAIVGRPIFGRALPALVRQHCPEIFGLAEQEGYEFVVDLPENTHDALARGEVYFDVIEKTKH